MKVLGFLLILAGCSGCDDEETKAADAGVPEVTGDAVKNYAALVQATYADSLTAARALDTAIDAFLAGPDAEKLEAARVAWKAAREPYLQSEVFRFYEGPIDDPTSGPEGLLNAWPLDEAYIDSVEGNPTAGIINDPGKMLTADALVGLNEQGGEENIATGFHAIEFLLWGQDRAEDGPGARPHTDYLPAEQGGTAPNPDRRGTYLRLVSDLLVSHLESLATAWEPTAAYRVELEGAAPLEGLRRILTGMIVLSGFETGGERLQTALDSGDQEDEHSCFSDNTHRDMVQDVRGVQNVWLGRYGSVSGPGVKDVVAARNADLANRIDAQIAESLRLAEALVPPFDREIATGNTEGRARVEALITSLRAQERLLQDAFRAFGLNIPVVE